MKLPRPALCRQLPASGRSTQPTLSQPVAAIEQRMCTTLLERVGKRKGPTQHAYEIKWLNSLWVLRN